MAFLSTITLVVIFVVLVQVDRAGRKEDHHKTTPRA
jgi:hypothetical protein